MSASIVILVYEPDGGVVFTDQLERAVLEFDPQALRAGEHEYQASDGSWFLEFDLLADRDDAIEEYSECSLPSSLVGRVDLCSFIFVSYRNERAFLAVLEAWLRLLGDSIGDVYIDNDFGELLTGREALRRARDAGTLRDR